MRFYLYIFTSSSCDDDSIKLAIDFKLIHEFRGASAARATDVGKQVLQEQMFGGKVWREQLPGEHQSCYYS